ncbi:uncharacterized protein LOC126794980 isoform X2 [Argentina anserina]|uniref:uncharacterized protein LOC126794980 isoform X2 n=1 Tax=Argentina anserina TaxID=57926 RepID=UPI00217680BB|nr:uncharacterized protein LOC126794980 isoform X2 [Potentilla anserina]
MGIRARPSFSAESDDANDDAIPAIISNLKTAFSPADYARAERALLARESNLKREIEKQKKENAKLLEADHFRELEMLKLREETVAGSGSGGVIVEQRRRIRELERQNLKLEGLVKSEYEGWKGLVSKLEADAKKLRRERGGLGVRSDGVGVVVKLEMDAEANATGGLASSVGSSVLSVGNGGVKDSGIRKFSSEDAGLDDRHNECAPKETEMLCENSEVHKDAESLGLTGVERKLRVPKRKLVSSLSGSDDKMASGKIKEHKNSNSEMKQCQKLSLDPDCPLDFSGSNVFKNQNSPSHVQVNSKKSEEKLKAEKKSQLFHNAPMEVSSDSDNDPSSNLSSSSSSSSDSEDIDVLLSQIDEILPKLNAREGPLLSSEDKKMM